MPRKLGRERSPERQTGWIPGAASPVTEAAQPWAPLPCRRGPGAGNPTAATGTLKAGRALWAPQSPGKGGCGSPVPEPEGAGCHRGLGAQSTTAPPPPQPPTTPRSASVQSFILHFFFFLKQSIDTSVNTNDADAVSTPRPLPGAPSYPQVVEYTGLKFLFQKISSFDLRHKTPTIDTHLRKAPGQRGPFHS